MTFFVDCWDMRGSLIVGIGCQDESDYGVEVGLPDWYVYVVSVCEGEIDVC